MPDHQVLDLAMMLEFYGRADAEQHEFVSVKPSAIVELARRASGAEKPELLALVSAAMAYAESTRALDSMVVAARGTLAHRKADDTRHTKLMELGGAAIALHESKAKDGR